MSTMRQRKDQSTNDGHEFQRSRASRHSNHMTGWNRTVSLIGIVLGLVLGLTFLGVGAAVLLQGFSPSRAFLEFKASFSDRTREISESIVSFLPPMHAAASGPSSDSSDDTDSSQPAAAATSAPKAPARDRPQLKNGFFTVEELSYFDGQDGRPAYLSIMGEVYDVSSGKKHYGSGGYGFFVGRDATRAFITGCFQGAGLTHDLRGLNEEQLKGLDHWTKFYREHKSYKHVGKVKLPEVDPDSPLPHEPACGDEQ